MPVYDDFENFRRQALETKSFLLRDYRDRLVEAIGFMYEELIQFTEESDSVDTGAYRSEHIVLHNGGIIFEHPERAGPDTIYPSDKARGAAPTFDTVNRDDVESDARDALSEYAVSKMRKITFINQRFYASILESGGGNIEARQIYGRAGDSLRSYIERLAVRASTERGLR